ncbi:hypothetical protein LPU83_3739 [Rhizobium favelukesii]|uniref:Uncharacterized protein n=1 Tax=Rhizobium favelukesii TaxID=348824 RepID=W6RDM1_9HYPH|nr:hypothetical protein LPU83_3739 [Rhizobium favelukesii]
MKGSGMGGFIWTRASLPLPRCETPVDVHTYGIRPEH